MKLHLSQNDSVHFTATTETGHLIPMEASADLGGENRGARPMEVVLAGLGGCSAIDVVLILKKSRQDAHHVEIVIDADRKDAIPAVFERIHLHYIVTGNDLDEKKVKRAVDLSVEKYCSVTKMLRESADITADFEIRASDK